MTPRTLLLITAKRFRDVGIPDPEIDGALLLSDLTGKPPFALRLDTDTELNEHILQAFESFCKLRLTRYPLQYIRHQAPFYNRTFYTDESVLIPRPETELLPEIVLAYLGVHPEADHVLDLCCGTGCIGITIALEAPQVHVTLADLSPLALETARKNANNLDARVVVEESDLYDQLHSCPFDVIVTNPPYIPSAACDTLQEEVLYEPRLALDGGNDGLFFYRRIINGAPDFLRKDGLLCMEVGYGQSEAVGKMLELNGFDDILVYNDMAGIERVVTGILR